MKIAAKPLQIETSQVVQKQTFGEVETRTVIWWQVMSKMFAPKIIKICQSFFKSQ